MPGGRDHPISWTMKGSYAFGDSKMICTEKLVAIFTGMVMLVTPLGTPPQTKGSDAPALEYKLDKRVQYFDAAGRTLVENVVDLAYEYQLPLGIEYLDREALRRPIDLRLQNESVRGILTAIVQQVPEYSVTFSDGLVDIFDPQEREDRSNLLNTIIKNVNITGREAGEANQELACALAHEIDPSTVCVASIAKGQLGQQKITLHLQNVKVYEVINAIVAQNQKAIWTVIADRSSLTDPRSSDLWHIYPLQAPFKQAVLDKLLSLKQ